MIYSLVAVARIVDIEIYEAMSSRSPILLTPGGGPGGVLDLAAFPTRWTRVPVKVT